eukprot:13434222-Ditylum_brightwellii.AAC.1
MEEILMVSSTAVLIASSTGDSSLTMIMLKTTKTVRLAVTAPAKMRMTTSHHYWMTTRPKKILNLLSLIMIMMNMKALYL